MSKEAAQVQVPFPPPRRKGQKTTRPSFIANTAKSLIGKKVNLHLKDDSTIIKVEIVKVEGNHLLFKTPRTILNSIFLSQIAYAENVFCPEL